ncbi:MAG: elongation factor G [Flavobacteriales bacterium]|nr:elongation factor G [Flavobacteriales bacterium]
MKEYSAKNIKNIVLIGGSKTGKTTLAETMVFEAGLLKRRGTVEEGTTVSDYHDIEKERGNSVYATSLHTEWRDYKINIIDTPGLYDFIGETVSSMRVSDTCVMLMSAQHGYEVSNDNLWEYVHQFQKPVIMAINQMDNAQADFDTAWESIKRKFGSKSVLMQYPYNQGEKFDSIIDLLKMTMYKFGPDGGKPEKLPIPKEEIDKANELHNELVEKAAENDEDLMELYFDKGNLDEDELRKGIKIGMMKHDLFPTFVMSAKKNMGSGRMMGFIDNVAPSAVDVDTTPTASGDIVANDPNKKTSLFVFKTLVEPFLGKVNFFKVEEGTLKVGQILENAQTETSETVNRLYLIDGSDRKEVDEVKCGDIAAMVKLKDTQTCHTLKDKESKMIFSPLEFPSPLVRKAIKAINEAEEEKMVDALKDIHSEDPTFLFEYAKELKQLLVHGQGELHLNTVLWKLKNTFNIEAEYFRPKIAYRETIQKSAKSTYKHKKQSGGAGQFGEVYMEIEPYYEGMPKPTGYSLRGVEEVELPWGGKLVFYNCIVGGVIDTRYIPAIMKGVMEKMEQGPVTDSYVRDVRVIVYDGKMHPVDSNDISFKIAGAHAFKEAFHNANPKILEPIHELHIKVPEELMGEVMTDLQSRRAMVQGMDSKNHYSLITANIPLTELYDYSTSLRSITQGRASFSHKFLDYEAVPRNIQDELAKKSKEAVES